VFLGGSYGRGDGGVRRDRENGILYNDLDFFVFAENAGSGAEKLLRDIARKYEALLKVDVDFSRVMTVRSIVNNAPRLMMQELKRGYRLVCGEDLLAAHLPERPAAELPFTEACRLLLNRGMGLLLAADKLAAASTDDDFILRNIFKALLGAGDAAMIADGQYRWRLQQRLDYVEESAMPENWKALYREAVNFKQAPSRRKGPERQNLWNSARDFLLWSICHCAGTGKTEDVQKGLRARCGEKGEISAKNYITYCIKSRNVPLSDWKRYTVPAVAALLPDLVCALNGKTENAGLKSKLYRQWMIFN
jgi:hypothetical protein